MNMDQDTPKRMAQPARTRADRLRARRNSGTLSNPVPPASTPQDSEENREERILKPPPRMEASGNVFARPVKRNNPLRNESLRQRNLHKIPSVARRFTIPLNKRGAELQVSALPFTQFGWRGASGFLVIFSVVMLILFTQMKIDTIQFVGVSDALAGDIRNTLQVEGKPAFTIDPSVVQHTMTIAFPEISDARILISFPGIMKVQAKARTPLYAWLMGDRVYLIDDQWMVYPAHAGENIDGLLAIQADQLPPPASILQQSGDILAEIENYVWSESDDTDGNDNGTLIRSTYLVDEEIMKGFQNMIPFIPEDASILYSGVHGFGWKAANGWDAWFGLDLSQMETKVGIYNAIVLKLAAEDTKASLISVEYIRAPYYREE